MPFVLYRIVHDNPPTEADFLSFAALGRQLRRPTPQLERLTSGISMYDTVDQARAVAAGAPGFRLGGFIATLAIPDDGLAVVEKTLGAGHYTVWGDPAVLIGYVVAVVS